MQCQKHNSHLVRKHTANGLTQFTYQCKTCGQIDRTRTGAGPWVVKPAGVDLESLPLWDEQLQQCGVNAAKLQAEAARAERDEAWWAAYSAYLLTPEWRRRRAKALERDGYLCQGCLEAVACEVHHITYERLFNELICDLVSLCHDCHQQCHPHKDLKGRELSGRSLSVH